jgi:hypothetical protein
LQRRPLEAAPALIPLEEETALFFTFEMLGSQVHVRRPLQGDRRGDRFKAIAEETASRRSQRRPLYRLKRRPLSLLTFGMLRSQELSIAHE